MSKLYVNQTDFKLRLETNADISSKSVYKIKYTNPNGTSGEWPGELSGTSQIDVQFDSTTKCDIEGVWLFWPYTETSSGLIATGERVKLLVALQGE